MFLAQALALAAATPDGAGSRCFWVEGRLTVGNGTPSVRIWPRGTKRLLGVTTRLHESEGPDVIPGNVRAFLESNRTDRVWGRFRVCPLAADRPGWMRPVTLVRARRLVSASSG
jgi:hypothetical protein